MLKMSTCKIDPCVYTKRWAYNQPVPPFSLSAVLIQFFLWGWSQLYEEAKGSFPGALEMAERFNYIAHRQKQASNLALSLFHQTSNALSTLWLLSLNITICSNIRRSTCWVGFLSAIAIWADHRQRRNWRTCPAEGSSPSKSQNK